MGTQSQELVFPSVCANNVFKLTAPFLSLKKEWDWRELQIISHARCIMRPRQMESLKAH